MRLTNLAAGVLALSTGCGWLIEPKPDVDAPLSYELDGITLSYPGNWKASQEIEPIEGSTMTTVTFESPGNALAFLQQIRPGVSIDPKVWGQAYLESIAQGATEQLGGVATIEGQSSETTNRSIFGQAREGRRERFSVSLLGQKVPHTLDLYPIELEDRTIVFVTQVSDDDRDKTEPGFDLILDSARVETVP